MSDDAIRGLEKDVEVLKETCARTADIDVLKEICAKNRDLDSLRATITALRHTYAEKAELDALKKTKAQFGTRCLAAGITHWATALIFGHQGSDQRPTTCSTLSRYCFNRRSCLSRSLFGGPMILGTRSRADQRSC
jgi:hypothetical protein